MFGVKASNISPRTWWERLQNEPFRVDFSEGNLICRKNTSTSFWTINMVHERQVERKIESWELVQPWRVNSRECWSVIGVNWSWKT